MKKITLDNIIRENLKDKEFAMHYQKELMLNAISKMITKIRKKAHLTQGQLAKKAGTTQPVIARLESGIDPRVPSLDLLARIAAASNMKLSISFEENRHRRS